MLTKLHFALFTIVQLPPGTQNPDDNFPVDFKDPFEVIVFVILPILLSVGYILWKRTRNNRKDLVIFRVLISSCSQSYLTRSKLNN